MDTDTAPVIVDARPMAEGAGARIKRLFPVPQRHHHDPFVLFDEFFVAPGAGFPPHPHRGFEAITYVFAGAFRHEDNLGNATTVGAGGAQRFTAGRGLVHSEMPEGSGEAHGIQLWINLARSDKGIDPTYQQVDAGDIPERRIGGAIVRMVVGAGSPVTVRTPTRYEDVRLAAGATYPVRLMPDWTRLLYVTEGTVNAGETRAQAGQAFINPPADVTLTAGEDARIVLIAGRPHKEPIVLRGSFVE
jgi:redox-sensitive bicupin YhaK (pirin superfamily)